MKKIKEHVILLDIILILLFILTTFILRLFNIRFQMWFNYSFALIIIISLLFVFIRFVNRTKNKINLIIIFISIIVLTNILLLLILTSSEISILLKGIVPSIIRSEKVIDINNKKYIGIKENTKNHAVSYYEYYGPFLMGTNLKILELPKKDSETKIYTYYDNCGKITKKEEVTYHKNEKGEITSEDHNVLFPIEKPKENTYINDYLLPEEEEILYKKKFDNITMCFAKYDVALGQTNLVHVIISKDGGKKYRRIDGDTIYVSEKAQFTFIDELNGFAAENGLIRVRDDDGMYVTLDGGKTFNYSTFNYDNDTLEYIRIDKMPYLEDGVLKLNCSHHNHTYKLLFVSKDKGLTWNLEK